jgi:hypothetical protein
VNTEGRSATAWLRSHRDRYPRVAVEGERHAWIGLAADDEPPLLVSVPDALGKALAQP